MDDNERQRGGNTTEQIKNQIGEMPQVVFDVVAEDPEEPKVPNDVEQVGMQKHRSENCQERCRNWILRRAVESAGEVFRNKSELKDQSVKMPRPLKLHWKLEEDEHQHVQRDDEIIHVGRTESWLVVAYGKHVRTELLSH